MVRLHGDGDSDGTLPCNGDVYLPAPGAIVVIRFVRNGEDLGSEQERT